MMVGDSVKDDVSLGGVGLQVLNYWVQHMYACYRGHTGASAADPIMHPDCAVQTCACPSVCCKLATRASHGSQRYSACGATDHIQMHEAVVSAYTSKAQISALTMLPDATHTPCRSSVATALAPSHASLISRASSATGERKQSWKGNAGPRTLCTALESLHSCYRTGTS